jgi:hypothetical protein
MRHLLAVVLALASGVIGGCCFPWPGQDRTPMNAARRTPEADLGHSILLDVALIERPVGDSFLNQELWDLGNEQGIALEVKPILEENGLRVGQIGGLLPPRLQALLRSPRTCPNPRRLRAEPDQPAPVQIGLPRSILAFEIHETAQSRALELSDAVCYFEVTPTLDGDESVRLRFTPRIRHGKSRIEPRVARDPDGPLRLAVEAKEPIEEFPHLAWELTINPDEYVLVGARRDRPGTLGSGYFFTPDGVTQTLLVLRATRFGAQAVDETLGLAPPLAMQASWTARGSSR